MSRIRRILERKSEETEKGFFLFLNLLIEIFCIYNGWIDGEGITLVTLLFPFLVIIYFIYYLFYVNIRLSEYRGTSHWYSESAKSASEGFIEGSQK
jgi:hypothetical protein